MNESFMRKIYEAGPELDENMMQQGLNFYGQQFKNLIQTFPGTDAPIFLAAMKGPFTIASAALCLQTARNWKTTFCSTSPRL